jgi:hypothetical protein
MLDELLLFLLEVVVSLSQLILWMSCHYYNNYLEEEEESRVESNQIGKGKSKNQFQETSSLTTL